MLKLIYNELTDPRTLTFKTMNRHHEAIERLEKKLEREKAFDLALTNYLQTYGEMTWEQYNCVVAWFVHSDKPIPEIFQEIENGG